MNWLLFRRIATALESLAKSQADLARIAVDDWQLRRVRPKPAKVEFGVMDPSEVDKLWAARQEKEALGEYEDDDQREEEIAELN